MAWRAQAAKRGRSPGDGCQYEKIESTEEGEQVYCHIRDLRMGEDRVVWLFFGF